MVTVCFVAFQRCNKRERRLKIEQTYILLCFTWKQVKLSPLPITQSPGSAPGSFPLGVRDLSWPPFYHSVSHGLRKEFRAYFGCDLALYK